MSRLTIAGSLGKKRRWGGRGSGPPVLSSRKVRVAVACGATALTALALGPGASLSASAPAAESFSIGRPVPLVSIGRGPVFRTGTPPGPGSCGCYEPAQFQAAYKLASLYADGDNGAGSTIVLVDAYGSPTIKADLAAFDTGFDLPAPPRFKIIKPEGAITGSNSDWAVETTLDVEYSHAIAPGANILLVETPVNETIGAAGFKQIVAAENYVIENEAKLGITGGVVISQSFGAAEQTFGGDFAKKIARFRSAYKAAKAAGVTVLASSGDQGVTSCENVSCSELYNMRVANWPSSDPLVTSVGGLKFSITTTSPYKESSPPVVWNESSGAGGGGDSAVFPTPAFQSSVSSIVGAWRGTPDMSMSASADTGGAELYRDGSWFPVGGTSEASPEFAGIVAIADQVAGKGLGYLNPVLYAMESASDPGIVDITSGNNSFDGVTGYTAVAGYDMASGLGTVDAATFVPELVAEAAKVG
jgi:subtilase family serine protease